MESVDSLLKVYVHVSVGILPPSRDICNLYVVYRVEVSKRLLLRRQRGNRPNHGTCVCYCSRFADQCVFSHCPLRLGFDDVGTVLITFRYVMYLDFEALTYLCV